MRPKANPNHTVPKPIQRYGTQRVTQPRGVTESTAGSQIATSMVPKSHEKPPTPAKWGDDPAHLELWDEAWEVGLGFWNPRSDKRMVERWVELNVMRDEMIAEAREDGYYDYETGKTHPLLVRVEKLNVELRSIEDRLALNPESRVRLGLILHDDSRVDPLDALRQEL